MREDIGSQQTIKYQAIKLSTCEGIDSQIMSLKFMGYGNQSVKSMNCSQVKI